MRSLLKKLVKQVPQIKRLIDEKKALLEENDLLKKKLEAIFKSENKLSDDKSYLVKKYYDSKNIENINGPVILVSRPIAFTFPLSYAYLAGYLKEKGEDVKIIFKDKEHKLLAKEIINLKPLIVGFGNLYPELIEIKSIIKCLNEAGRDFPIVVGGQMVSPTPEFALKITGADYGVIGEGEIILNELVKGLRNKKDISKINGLAIRENEEVKLAVLGECIENLSELPQIPYEMFPENEWLHIGKWYTKNMPEQPHWRYNDRVINIHGGRGCPFSCNFCYHHNKPRYRSIDIMMDEAERALERFNGNMLYFSDDLVLANPKRTRELIDAIKNLKKPIEYSMSTRFDILDKISDELLFEMKGSGCRIMGLGIESGSNRILKLMGKNITVEKILSNLERLKNVGILPTGSIMVGQYTETREDVDASIKLLRESVRTNPNIQYAFSITTPFPGSQLYDLIFQKGYLKDDEEFYNRYFNTNGGAGDWNQVVNLSEMEDTEVIELRNEMEKIYIEEKFRAFGKNKMNKLLKIESEEKALAIKVDSLNSEKERAQIENIEKRILKLEKEKLKIRGLL